MPNRKLAAAALHSVKKKLRSKLPLRRPRPSHFYSFLNDFTIHHRRFTSSSSTSLLLCRDEPILSVDDSSRVTLDHSLLFPSSSSSSSRVVAVTDYCHKSFSDRTDVAALDVVSESFSCVESCSVVGESSADAIGNRKQFTGFSALHCPAASEFYVTSQERRPQISDHRFLKPTTVDDDDDGVSIVDEGGLDSPIPVNIIGILDCPSSEQNDSDFSLSIYIDSGTDFSERSVGDSSPSLTYSYLLQYRLAFQRSSAPLAAVDVHSHHRTTEPLWSVDQNGEEECYLSLRSRERRQAYLLDYTKHSHLLIKRRFQIVHWIIEQSAKKELQKETVFLGVNLLDRFLSHGIFKNRRNGNLQIAGIACLTLATRIEENQIHNSVHQSTFRMGHNTYSRAEVVAMEWLVQEVLSFKCFLPTVYNFLSFYLKVARADTEMAMNARHLAELALLEPEQLSYWPSTVAASLVILSALPNHYLPRIRLMKAHLRSEDDNIDECIKSLSLSLKIEEITISEA